NTTYWIRVGALYNDTTNYSSTLSTSTLTSPITDPRFYQVFVTSVAVEWTALGSAVGYRLEAYNDSSYTSLAGSSQTVDGVSVSTLTIEGLSAYTTYWFRVGGINHNSVVNYTAFGSTR